MHQPPGLSGRIYDRDGVHHYGRLTQVALDLDQVEGVLGPMPRKIVTIRDAIP